MAAGIGFFIVGEKFFSLEELNRAKLDYEKSNYVNMVMRDAKLLDAVSKYAPKRVRGARADLRYYTVRLCCTFGGRKYKKQGHNKRLTGTRKVDCQAFVRLLLSEDGQSLDVVESQLDHSNHVISKEVYLHLPMQRRLDDADRLQAETLLSVCGSPKLVQQHMQNVSGKVVLLKDIANISHKLKQRPSPNNLKSVLQQLEASGDSVVDVLVSEDNSFKGIFFQDLYMQNVFEAYPEMIIVGETFQLTDLHLTSYLMLVIDGNGQSEVVALLLLADDSRTTVSAAFEAFQHHNPTWLNTQTILTDTDFVERQVFPALFPDVSLVLCLNSTIRTFRQDITCEKMNITTSERDTCWAILKDMVHAFDEAAYNANLDRLKAVGCQNVLEYFESWHDLRCQWVDGLKGQQMSMGETTNHRLEIVSAKMKDACNEHAGLQQFFIDFRAFLASMRSERTHRALTMLTKKPTLDVEEDLIPYRDSLTPYAFQIVNKQYKQSLSLSTSTDLDDDVVTFVFQAPSGTVTTRLGCCLCRTYNSTRLPCKHLLYVRRLRGMPFDESVFDTRWKRADYLEHCQLNPADANDADAVLDINSGIGGAVENPGAEQRAGEQAEKYRKAHHMTDQLAKLCARPGISVFEPRMKLLLKLYENWSRGIEVELVKLESSGEDAAPPFRRRRGRPPKSSMVAPVQPPKPKHRRPGRPKGHSNKRKQPDVTSVPNDCDYTEVNSDCDDSTVSVAMGKHQRSVFVNHDNIGESVELDLDLTASAEDDASVILVAAADNDIADINDCISDGPEFHRFVSSDSGPLSVDGNNSLEFYSYDAVSNIIMPSSAKRKRGRPPKSRSNAVPSEKHQCLGKSTPVVKLEPETETV